MAPARDNSDSIFDFASETLSERKDKSYSRVYLAHTYRPGY